MEELSDAFINVVKNITDPAWSLIWALGLLVGTLWTANILIRLSKSRVPGNQPVSTGEFFAVLFVAAMLSHYSGWISSVSNSMGLGDASFGPISYVSSSGDLGRFAEVINAAMTFASLMGGIYGFKGLLLLRKSASGGGQGKDLVGKAVVHIIFGGLLVRIAEFISAAAESAN